MNQENPLFYLFKKLSWPVGLIIIAVLISSLGSITGLVVPFFTGKLVDKFSFENINWMFIIFFISIFIIQLLILKVLLLLVEYLMLELKVLILIHQYYMDPA